MWHAFEFNAYPPYFNISQAFGEYAWKPIILREVSARASAVLWLDAGCRLAAVRTLPGLLQRITADGIMSTRTRGTVGDWTHPGMLRELGVSGGILTRIRKQPMCNGAIVGIGSNAARETVLEPWARCALHRACIAPPGSSRQNHRQDQAALSVLAHLKGFNATCRIPEGRWRRSKPGSRLPWRG